MSRRAIKKMMRRAEDALNEERFGDAEAIYRTMLERFQLSLPSLLDHAGAVYGLVRVLHAAGESERAAVVAESAADILAPHMAVELAA